MKKKRPKGKVVCPADPRPRLVVGMFFEIVDRRMYCLSRTLGYGPPPEILAGRDRHMLVHVRSMTDLAGRCQYVQHPAGYYLIRWQRWVRASQPGGLHGSITAVLDYAFPGAFWRRCRREMLRKLEEVSDGR